jgi:hypothetical protein
MHAHHQQSRIVDGPSAQAQSSSHQTPKKPNQSQLSQLSALQYDLGLGHIHIVLHLELLLMPVHLGRHDSHTDASQNESDLDHPVLRRTMHNPNYGGTVAILQQQVHHDDTANQKQANTLLHKLEMAAFPLHNIAQLF